MLRFFGKTPIYLMVFVYLAQKLRALRINKMKICIIEKAENWWLQNSDSIYYKTVKINKNVSTQFKDLIVLCAI